MINIAILGCGNIGTRHAKWAAKYGNLVAVCDANMEKAKILAKRFNCKAYFNFTNMLMNDNNIISLVAICTPSGFHKEHTKIALRNNCHVLCEKPMALNVEDCEEMIHAAEKYSKRLFIVKQNRFNEPVQLVKKLIKDGKLGKILGVHLNCIWNRNKDYYKKSQWTGTRDMDGGILFTQFSHFIDLLYYLVGDIERACSTGKNFMHTDTITFPDTIATAFKFVNGAVGTGLFTINSYNKSMEGSILLVCEKGTVKIGGKYLNEIEYQNIEGDNYYVPVTNANLKSRHDAVYKNVINSLSHKEYIVTDMLDGLKTVQIIKKIMDGYK